MAEGIKAFAKARSIGSLEADHRIANHLAGCPVKFASKGSILIMVSDNGPGLGSAGTGKTDGGLGTRLVKALSAQIGSPIEY
ncbi:signal transduction histidine kinase [Labrenzia sp. MBR-25]